MCWKSSNPILQVVEGKPKKVYKILLKFGSELRSPIRKSTKWEIGECKTVNLGTPIRRTVVFHYLEIDEGLHCINTIPYKDKYGCWKVNGNHLFHSEFCESIFECDKLTVLQCVGTLKRNQN